MVAYTAMSINRRSFIASGAGFMFQYGGIKENLILRSDSPADFETPVSLLDKGWITANDLHYVRSHLPTPRVDPSTFNLSIDGEVNSPLKLTLDDIKKLPQVSQTVTLECSGNGRVYSEPTVPGLQWEKGAVGTARWTGARLVDVLKSAGLKPTGKYITMNGADEPMGTVPDFVRSIPIEKATHPDTILAYQMNGVDIPIHHGFPLRLITPGWEAASSTKWLVHINVAQTEFDGNFMRNAYRIPNRLVAPGSAVDPKDMVVYTRLEVKSIFTAPFDGARFKLGQPIELRGFAWAGEDDVAKVDISVDLGRSWVPATLDTERARYAWRRFRYNFRTTQVGSYQPLCRATDSKGKVQPIFHAWNPSGYLHNVIDKVRVHVDA